MARVGVAGVAVAGVARGGRRHSWSRYSGRTFYLFVSPWILGFLLLTATPLVYAFAMSLTNFDGASDRWKWVGLSNYTELLRDSDAWASLLRTLGYAAIAPGAADLVPHLVRLDLGRLHLAGAVPGQRQEHPGRRAHPVPRPARQPDRHRAGRRGIDVHPAGAAPVHVRPALLHPQPRHLRREGLTRR